MFILKKNRSSSYFQIRFKKKENNRKKINAENNFSLQ